MKRVIDIDPGTDPNPPVQLSAKQLALQKIRQLKRDLADLEKTVRSIKAGS